MNILKNNLPDMVVIGAGILIHHGFDILEEVKSIPTTILLECEGLDNLLSAAFPNLYYLVKPFSPEEIPDMLYKTCEILKSCKEK